MVDADDLRQLASVPRPGGGRVDKLLLREFVPLAHDPNGTPIHPKNLRRQLDSAEVYLQ